MGKVLWALEGTGTPGNHTFPPGSGTPVAAHTALQQGKPQVVWTLLEGGSLCSTVNERPPLERGTWAAKVALTPPTPGWMLVLGRGRGMHGHQYGPVAAQVGTAILLYCLPHSPQHQTEYLTHTQVPQPGLMSRLGSTPQPLLNPRPQVPQTQEAPHRVANSEI